MSPESVLEVRQKKEAWLGGWENSSDVLAFTNLMSGNSFRCIGKELFFKYNDSFLTLMRKNEKGSVSPALGGSQCTLLSAFQQSRL